ncbi:hypothetical protein [Anaerovorax odorimutans]
MQRKQTYACNIVYASAKQVGFDYLSNYCDYILLAISTNFL